MKLRWKPAWTLILVLVLGARIVLGILGAQIVASGEPNTLAPGPEYEATVALLNTDDFSRQFINPWLRWDTVWYLNISEFGYVAGNGSIVFAPLYPFLVRIFSVICGGNPLLAALLLSTLFSGIALILLYELFERKFSIVISLLLFPTAFFLLAGYTESLFLMLVLATFLFARKKSWLWAGIFAGLSVLARFQGIVLSGVLLWALVGNKLGLEALSPREQVAAMFDALKNRTGWARLWQRESRLSWSVPLIPLLSFFLYVLWLRAMGLGNPSVELDRLWGIRTVAPWTGSFLFIHRLFTTPRVFVDWIDLSLFALMVVLAIFGLKHLDPAYSIYIWGSLAVMLMRGTPPHLLDSFSRYMLMLFPLFSLLGKIRSRVWQVTLGGVAILLQLFLLMGFFDWRWIA